jgi:gas vesicle protein
MGRVLRVIAGMLLGAALGAGLVLLFAPQSGDEVRRKIQERIQDILAEGHQAAEERRLELTAQFESLKQPVSES